MPRPFAAGKPRKKKRLDKALIARLEHLDYKDTDLLRMFISDRGKIRSRRVTGLTVRQQHAMARAVKNAREMALLPYASSTFKGGR